MLLFSIIAVVLTLCVSVYAYYSNLSLLDANTSDTLNALGSKILNEVEQHVQLMNYAVDELHSNVEFMDAMYLASAVQESESVYDQLSMQTVMSRWLYQEPLLGNFFRVNVYAPNGLYLSSRFEKTDTVACFSDEAKELVASLDYLEQVKKDPFVFHLVGPHSDPWSLAQNIPVISAVKAVYWHGAFVGYIEVSSLLSDFTHIFSVENLDGFTAYAHFPSASPDLSPDADEQAFGGLDENIISKCLLSNGSECFALRIPSTMLNLSILVSQDMSSYRQKAQELLLQSLSVGGVILSFGIVFIVVSSKRLTLSIRLLTQRIRNLPNENLLNPPDDLALQHVASPRDQEIYRLEQVFNDLLTRLRKATINELALQQSTLQAQLNALQTQINPHFVYNTLNIISAKGMECGNEEIIDICDRFAQMLRYSTDTRSRTATLDQEIVNARHYLLLAKARYEDRLEFDIHMPEHTVELRIPKLTLQPIVENALRHGFTGCLGKHIIRLEGTLRENNLVLTIRDNGCGFSEEVLLQMKEAFDQIDQELTPFADPSDGHIGLINTYLRLHYYSQGKIHMSLFNDGGAVVCLTFPGERSNDHV